jgi:1,4-dihydroxy-2-naphthoate octaprenyltransferase
MTRPPTKQKPDNIACYVQHVPSSLSSPPLYVLCTDLLILGRPFHLLGGMLFYSLGLVAAWVTGAPMRWPVAATGLLTVLAAQLMNHYSNDYFDLAADRLNLTPTRWTGGSRVLPEGRLPPWSALLAALICGCVALVALFLSVTSSPDPWLSLGVLLPAMILAWIYNGPPLRLNWSGLGEISGAILIPGLTSLAGFVLQRGALVALPLLLATPLCLLQFGQLIAANVPDAAGDAAAGKRTLVVRLGVGRSAYLYLVVVALAYALLPLLVAWGLPWLVALASLGAAPIALWLVLEALSGWSAPERWDALGFWSLGLLAGSAMCQLVALMVLGFHNGNCQNWHLSV